MKISNNPAKYEVLIKQYLRSILDISALVGPQTWNDCGIEEGWKLNSKVFEKTFLISF